MSMSLCALISHACETFMRYYETKPIALKMHKAAITAVHKDTICEHRLLRSVCIIGRIMFI